MFNNISKDLDINGNVCEISENYFEYTNENRKLLENEYDSQFKDYRDKDEEKKTENFNKELNKLPIQKKLQKIDVNNDVMMGFDGNSLYPSAMRDENSMYPKIESGFAFAPHMKDVYVKAFNDQTFNEDGNEYALLRRKYYNPPNVLFQHLAAKEKS